jgi:hypothetical protein
VAGFLQESLKLESFDAEKRIEQRMTLWLMRIWLKREARTG